MCVFIFKIFALFLLVLPISLFAMENFGFETIKVQSNKLTLDEGTKKHTQMFETKKILK